MEIKEMHTKRNGEVYYTGKKVKFIKDYGSWVLVEYPDGYKEGINKQELGLVKKRDFKNRKIALSSPNGLRV